MRAAAIGRKLLGFVLAFLVVGILANLREPFAILTFAALHNSFPDFFAEDATRFMRNLEAVGNIMFLVIAYLGGRWIYRKVNPKPLKSEVNDVNS